MKEKFSMYVEKFWDKATELYIRFTDNSDPRLINYVAIIVFVIGFMSGAFIF